MSLLDDATMTSTFATPAAFTVACTAFTVRPLSGVPNGICSLRTSFTTPTLMVVFGATCVGTAITTVLPTWRKSMVVVPADPPQVVVDVDLPGNPTVVTLAQRTSSLTRPLSVATHGVDVVEEEVVEMKPVSGIGCTLTST